MLGANINNFTWYCHDCVCMVHHWKWSSILSIIRSQKPWSCWLPTDPSVNRVVMLGLLHPAHHGKTALFGKLFTTSLVHYWGQGLGVVSLTFRELSKIISRKYTIPEITFIVGIWSWNFVHALGTCSKFQLQILIRTTVSAINKFQENILESLRNVSETTPCCLTQ